MGRWICPECAQGKHVNCIGEAWDEENDELTLCGCPDTDETRHG